MKVFLGLLVVVSLNAQNLCSSPKPLAVSGAAWNGWGAQLTNDRYQSNATLTARQAPQLKLKWAYGFPGVRSVLGQPSVVGGRVFIGVDTGDVYSIDAATGCTYWTFKADAGVRTAITVANGSAFFGDLRSNAYAVNASTGELIWKVKVEDHPTARITGAPQFFEGRVYVPVASGEEGAGRNPKYECCTFRGSVVALEAATGKRVWKTYVIPDEPKPTKKTKAGVQMFAPSGAGIWSAPTIDAKRRALYVGTGDSYSEPAADTSDAIVAISLDTGKILWSVQDTEHDVWLAGCGGPGPPGAPSENCPETLGPDHDFGSPPMLKTFGGRDLLIAGQKSGNVWAHDPDKKGAVVWRSALVNNTKEFGGKIIWGGAADNDAGYFGLGPGGLGAVSLKDGERLWFAQVKPNVAAQPGLDGPLTAAPGVVFSGGWDGVLRALDAKTGNVIWDYNTAHDFETVNAVAAKGGSMGAAGPVVVGNRLFAPSGYIGVKNGLPGNVLLMFSAE
jgi:polyvinyl alcohol dehydrogenase (cytochrome)